MAGADATNFTIRPARSDDAAFVAYAMYEASRGHLERGMWDVMSARPRDWCLEWLKRMALIESPAWTCYAAGYLIAEVNGRAAAGLCGYDPAVGTIAELVTAINRATREMDIGDAELDQFWQRFVPLLTCTHPARERAWGVENVATLPEYRRRGLVDALLGEVCARGKAAGHPVAQLSVLIGNEAAIKAYEKRGFRIAGEKRNRDFEAALGAPGMFTMVCEL